ncbi:helix-turn-helix domain-containing protein [Aureisphaera galaxeae]|uniref:helix-turn-helix domain-containing protein n=1 Tax=Aureisphaera galaxeae TaxID=1538023 RepID=UPI0023506A30|nr:helix-turn-helix domain-containing protein [Aureisphaera galaxeae]MDC8002491.1 helix-turn-helix domain-containing protein [Aureisphaera galaxeae]
MMYLSYTMMDTLLNVLSITAFIQGCIVGVLLIFHPKFNTPMFTLLGVLVLLMGLECINQNGIVISKHAWLFWLNNGNLFLFGPLFYFFIRAAKTGIIPHRPVFILHIIPFLLIKTGTLVLGPNNLGEELLPPVFFLGLNYALTLHGTIYALLSLLVVIRNRKSHLSSLDAWVFWLSIIYACGWVFSFVARPFELVSNTVSSTMWAIAYITLGGMIYVVSVKLMIYRVGTGNRESEGFDSADFSLEKESKYSHSSLKPEEITRLTASLQNALLKEQLYLDPDLNRAKLAARINVSPHTLSQLLNNHLKTSFSEYINELRLEEAKRKLVDPSYGNYTILSIAFESGFSSKSSFQRLFKKFVGKTPSEYLAEKNTQR